MNGGKETRNNDKEEQAEEEWTRSKRWRTNDIEVLPESKNTQRGFY